MKKYNNAAKLIFTRKIGFDAAETGPSTICQHWQTVAIFQDTVRFRGWIAQVGKDLKAKMAALRAEAARLEADPDAYSVGAALGDAAAEEAGAADRPGPLPSAKSKGCAYLCEKF